MWRPDFRKQREDREYLLQHRNCREGIPNGYNNVQRGLWAIGISPQDRHVFIDENVLQSDVVERKNSPE